MARLSRPGSPLRRSLYSPAPLQCVQRPRAQGWLEPQGNKELRHQRAPGRTDSTISAPLGCPGGDAGVSRPRRPALPHTAPAAGPGPHRPLAGSAAASPRCRRDTPSGLPNRANALEVLFPPLNGLRGPKGALGRAWLGGAPVRGRRRFPRYRIPHHLPSSPFRSRLTLLIVLD